MHCDCNAPNFSVKGGADMQIKKNKKLLFSLGIVFLVIGFAILSVFVYKRISREMYKQKLLRECVVFEVPSLDIKVPVMDGTDKKILSAAAGHFENTGEVGSGNYCIAGHNSTIYAEIFNDLDNIKIGTEIYLYDNDEKKTCYTYEVSEKLIVNPEETWVLNDFDDDRLTVVTCTDDGKQRQVVIGIKK